MPTTQTLTATPAPLTKTQTMTAVFIVAGTLSLLAAIPTVDAMLQHALVAPVGAVLNCMLGH